MNKFMIGQHVFWNGAPGTCVVIAVPGAEGETNYTIRDVFGDYHSVNKNELEAA